MTHNNSEHPKDDGLSDYVERIGLAVHYNGAYDHEDVRSILKEITRGHLSKADLVEYLNGLYQPSISDLELDEHQGKDRPVVYLDEIIKHIGEK